MTSYGTNNAFLPIRSCLVCWDLTGLVACLCGSFGASALLQGFGIFDFCTGIFGAVPVFSAPFYQQAARRLAVQNVLVPKIYYGTLTQHSFFCSAEDGLYWVSNNAVVSRQTLWQ